MNCVHNSIFERVSILRHFDLREPGIEW